jgi:DNA-binding transcriptional LysR family regulator
LSVRHCSVEDVITVLARGNADIALTPTEGEESKDVFVFNCREFKRIVVVPGGHPLLGAQTLALEDIARYPLVMYEQSIPTRQQYLDIFTEAGITPTVVLNAINSDVIKACVESGLGIAILPGFVFSPERDTGLRALNAGHLFPPAYVKIAVHRKRPLRSHMLDFIQLLAPEWTRDRLERCLRHAPAES